MGKRIRKTLVTSEDEESAYINDAPQQNGGFDSLQKVEEFISGEKPSESIEVKTVLNKREALLNFEQILGEKELQIKEYFPTKLAKSIYDIHESISITDHTSHETVSELKPQEPKEMVILPDIRQQESLSVTEILTEDKEATLVEQTAKQAEAIRVQSMHESLLISEHSLQDTLNELVRSKPKEMIALPDVRQQESLSITEVMTEDKEDVFSKKDEKTAEATRVQSLQESILVTDQPLHDTFSELLQSKPNEMIAIPDVRQQESLSIIEVMIDDKEGIFTKKDDKTAEATRVQNLQESVLVTDQALHDTFSELLQSKPNEMIAIPDVRQQESLSITEVMMTDKEGKFTKKEDKTAEATSVRSLLESVLVTDQHLHDSYSELIQTRPNEMVAIPDVRQQESLSVTLTLVEDKESDLIINADKTAEAVKVHGTFESVCVTDQLSHEITNELLQLKPNEIAATPDFRPQESLSVTEVWYKDKEEEFTPKINQTVEAIRIQNLNESISITDQPSHEMFSDLVEKKPSVVNAVPDVRHLECLSVTEIIIDDKEDILATSLNKTAEATSIHNVHESICITDQTPHETLVELIRKKAHEANATPAVREHESVSVTEVLIDDKEESLKKEAFSEGQANVKHSIQESIAITQTQFMIKEGLDDSKKEKEEKARIEHSGTVSSVSVNELSVNESLGALKESENISEHCTGIYVEQNAAQINEVILSEREGGVHIEEHISDSATVLETALVSDHLSVLELESAESTANLPDDVRPKVQNIMPNALAQESLQVSEIHGFVSETEFLSKEHLTTTASGSIQESQAIEVENPIIREEAKLVDGNKLLPATTAEKSVGAYVSLDVSEVELYEGTDAFKDIVLNTETARKQNEHLQALTISEVKTESTTGEFECEKPITGCANPSTIQNESVTVDEITYHEKEACITAEKFTTGVCQEINDVQQALQINDKYALSTLGEVTLEKPLTDVASKALMTERAIEVEEQTIHLKEEQFLSKRSPDIKIESDVTVNEPAVEIRETRAQSPLKELVKQKSADKENAMTEFIEQKSVTVSEVSVSDKEFILKELLKIECQARSDFVLGLQSLQVSEDFSNFSAPEFQEIKMKLEKAKVDVRGLKAADVHEVIIQELEGLYNVKNLEKSYPTKLFEEHKPLLIEEVQLSSSLKDLPQDREVLKESIAPEIYSSTALMIEEPYMADKESGLTIESTVSQKAIFDLCEGHDSLNVTEVKSSECSEALKDVPMPSDVKAIMKLTELQRAAITSSVHVNEKEDLQQTITFDQHTAERAIDTEQSISVQEIKSQSPVREFAERAMPKTEESNVAFVPSVASVTTEISVNEKELITSESIRPTVSLESQLVSGENSIVVCQTFAQDSTMELHDKQLESCFATSEYLPKQVAMKSDVTYNEKEKEYIISKPTSDSANVNLQMGNISVEVIENRPESSLGVFQSAMAVMGQAISNIIPKKAIEIYSTLTSEKEGSVVEDKPLSALVIPTLMDTLNPLNVSETSVEDKESNFLPTKPQEEVASSNLIPYQAATMQETVAQDKESHHITTAPASSSATELISPASQPIIISEVLPETDVPERHDAKAVLCDSTIKIVSQDSVQVLVVDMQEKEKSFKEKEAQGSSATIDKEPNHPVAVIYDVNTLDHLKKLCIDERQETTASMSLQGQQVAEITEQWVQDSEMAMQIPKRDHSLAAAVIEGIQSVSVLEIEAGQKEALYETVPIPSSKNIETVPIIVPMFAPHVMHTETSEHGTTSSDTTVEFGQAQISVTGQIVAQVSQSDVLDSKKDFTNEEIKELQAEITHTESQSISVSEVSSETKEAPFESKQQMERVNIESKLVLVPRVSADVSHIITGEQEGTKLFQTPDQQYARQAFDEQKAAGTSQPLVHEKETAFCSLKEEEMKATQSLNECLSLEVSEVFSGNKEGVYQEPTAPIEHKSELKPVIMPLHIANIEETNMKEREGAVLEFDFPESSAQVNFIGLESVQTSQAVAAENEKAFEETEVLNSRAHPMIEEMQSVMISETVVDSKEGIHQQDRFPESHALKSKPVIVPMKLANVNEQTPNEIERGLRIPTIHEDMASLSVETISPLHANEPTVLGETKPFETISDLTSAAKEAIDKIYPLKVSEIEVDFKEESLPKMIPPNEARGRETAILTPFIVPSITQAEVAEHEDVCLANALTSASAKVLIDEKHAASVQQTVTIDREAKLDTASDRPDRATFAVNETHHICISEVNAEIKETETQLGEMPVSHSATAASVLAPLHVPKVSDTTICESTESIDVPKEVTSLAAVAVDAQNIAVVSQTHTSEKEESLSVVEGRKSNAKVFVDEVSSLDIKDKEQELVTTKESERNATKVLDEMKSLAVSVVNTVEEDKAFTETPTQAQLAKSELEGSALVLPDISTTMTSEKAGSFDKKFEPTRSEATAKMDSRESLKISQIMSHEKEDTMERFVFEAVSANRSIEETVAVTVDVVEAENERLKTFDEGTVNRQSIHATTVLQPMSAHSVHENFPEEREKQEISCKTESQVASTSFSGQNVVEILQSEVLDSSKSLESLPLDESQARILVNEQTPLIISEILPEQKEGFYKEETPKTETLHAKGVIAPRNVASVSETQITEKEINQARQFIEEVHAGVSMQESKYVTVYDVPINTKEGNLVVETPQLANLSSAEVLRPLNVANVDDTAVSEREEIMDLTVSSSQARRVLEEVCSVLITEIDISEIEQPTEDSLPKEKTAQATPVLMPMQSVSVSDNEVIENELPTPCQKVKDTSASVELETHRHRETAEIQSMGVIKDFTCMHPNKEKGTVVLEPSSHLTRTTQIVSESVIENEEPIKTDISHAHTVLDENETVFISSILMFDQTDTVKDEVRPTLEKALRTQPSSEHILITEVQVDQDSTFRKNEYMTDKAITSFDAQRPVTVSSVFIQETCEENGRPTSRKETAQSVPYLQEHLAVSEMKVQESTGDVIVSKPSAESAKRSISVQESVIVSQVCGSETPGDVEILRPLEDSAKILFGPQEALVVSETLSEEGLAKKIVQIEEAQAKSTTDQRSSVQVQTAEIHEEVVHLGDFVTEQISPEIREVEVLNTPSISEVQSQVNEAMPKAKKRQPEASKEKRSACDLLEVTEEAREFITEGNESGRAIATVIEGLQRAEQEDVLVLKAPQKSRDVLEILEEQQVSDIKVTKSNKIEPQRMRTETIDVQNESHPLVGTDLEEKEINIKFMAKKLNKSKKEISAEESEVVEELTAEDIEFDKPEYAHAILVIEEEFKVELSSIKPDELIAEEISEKIEEDMDDKTICLKLLQKTHEKPKMKKIVEEINNEVFNIEEHEAAPNKFVLVNEVVEENFEAKPFTVKTQLEDMTVGRIVDIPSKVAVEEPQTVQVEPAPVSEVSEREIPEKKPLSEKPEKLNIELVEEVEVLLRFPGEKEVKKPTQEICEEIQPSNVGEKIDLESRPLPRKSQIIVEKSNDVIAPEQPVEVEKKLDVKLPTKKPKKLKAELMEGSVDVMVKKPELMEPDKTQMAEIEENVDVKLPLKKPKKLKAELIEEPVDVVKKPELVEPDKTQMAEIEENVDVKLPLKKPKKLKAELIEESVDVIVKKPELVEPDETQIAEIEENVDVKLPLKKPKKLKAELIEEPVDVIVKRPELVEPDKTKIVEIEENVDVKLPVKKPKKLKAELNEESVDVIVKKHELVEPDKTQIAEVKENVDVKLPLKKPKKLKAELIEESVDVIVKKPELVEPDETQIAEIEENVDVKLPLKKPKKLKAELIEEPMDAIAKRPELVEPDKTQIAEIEENVDVKLPLKKPKKLKAELIEEPVDAIAKRPKLVEPDKTQIAEIEENVDVKVPVKKPKKLKAELIEESVDVIVKKPEMSEPDKSQCVEVEENVDVKLPLKKPKNLKAKLIEEPVNVVVKKPELVEPDKTQMAEMEENVDVKLPLKKPKKLKAELIEESVDVIVKKPELVEPDKTQIAEIEENVDVKLPLKKPKKLTAELIEESVDVIVKRPELVEPDKTQIVKIEENVDVKLPVKKPKKLKAELIEESVDVIVKKPELVEPDKTQMAEIEENVDVKLTLKKPKKLKAELIEESVDVIVKKPELVEPDKTQIIETEENVDVKLPLKKPKKLKEESIEESVDVTVKKPELVESDKTQIVEIEEKVDVKLPLKKPKKLKAESIEESVDVIEKKPELVEPDKQQIVEIDENVDGKRPLKKPKKLKAELTKESVDVIVKEPELVEPDKTQIVVPEENVDVKLPVKKPIKLTTELVEESVDIMEEKPDITQIVDRDENVDVKLPLKKPKTLKAELIEESVDVIVKKPELVEPDKTQIVEIDENVDVKLPLKKTKKLKAEFIEESIDVIVKKPELVEPDKTQIVEMDENVNVKLPLKKPKKLKAELFEESVDFIVKKPELVEPVNTQICDIEEDVDVKLPVKKPKKLTTELVEESVDVIVKKPEMVELDKTQIVEMEENVDVKLPLKKPKKLEEELIEDSVDVKLYNKVPKQIKEDLIEESGDITLKKPESVELETPQMVKIDESAEVKTVKKPKARELMKESAEVTLKKFQSIEPEKPQMADFEDNIEVKLPLKKTEHPMVNESIDLPMKLREPDSLTVEESQSVTIRKRSKPKQIVSDEQNVDIDVEAKKPETSILEEISEFDLKHVLPKPYTADSVQEEHQIVVKPDSVDFEKIDEAIQEEIQSVRLMRKPKKKYSITEETETEFIVTKPEVPTEDYKEFMPELIKKKHQEIREDVSVEIMKPTDYTTEETEEDVKIKMKSASKRYSVSEETVKSEVILQPEFTKEDSDIVKKQEMVEKKLSIGVSQPQPETIEEETESISIRKRPKKKSIITEETDERVTVRKPSKDEGPLASEFKFIPKNENDKETHQEIREDVDVSIEKPIDFTSEEATEEVNIRMKRKPRRYTIDEGSSEGNIIIHSEETEPESIVMESTEVLTQNVTMKAKSKKKTEVEKPMMSKSPSPEVPDEFTIKRKKKSYVIDDQEIEAQIRFRSSEERRDSDDLSESVLLGIRSDTSSEDDRTEQIEEVDGQFTFVKQPRQVEKKVSEETYSGDVRIPKAPRRAPCFSQAVTAKEVKVGDMLRAIATYVAEDDHENSMHLVEGERVYVIESSDHDWWFVEKHLTKERGYVPSKMLSVDADYTHYVRRRLEEKISSLPVFEKLKKGQKAEAPKITHFLESQTVADGQEVQFVVKVQGTPRPNVTWFRQTAIIKPSEEFQVFYSEDNTATLLIKEVFPEDAGLFTCVVKNLAGYAMSEAELVVDGPVSDHGSDTMLASRHGLSLRSLSRDSSVCDTMEGIPPTFAMKTINKTCEENAQFEVDVRLVAIPEPEIVWKKDGLILRDSNRIRIVRQKDVHAYRSIILIKGTRKEDEGEYQVYCKNREGEAKCSIFLKITAPEEPVFEELFSDTTVEELGTIRLVARIRGIPTPDITWSRQVSNGKKIKLENNVIARYGDEVAVLEVQHASKSDAGKYVCTATNKMGKVSHSANVTVGSDVVTFKKGLESCVVEENSQAVLECRTSRDKEVKWWKGKMEITSSERITLEHEGLTHRLVIHSAAVNDTGKYKCTFDDQSTWCNMTIKPLEEFVQKLQDVEVLEKDEAVLFVEVSSEKCQVSWHKDGEEIVGDDRMKVLVDGRIRRLIITSASVNDEGEYTCVLGDLESTCELTVRELPAEIVKDMTDQTVNKAEKASFAVELSKGDAVITWYKDGSEIRFSDHYQLSIDGKVQRLLIYNCQADDDGVYRAVVGKTECSARLKVEGQIEGDFLKKLPPQMDVISSTDAEFTVEITKEQSDVTWLRCAFHPEEARQETHVDREDRHTGRRCRVHMRIGQS
ncbi:hypothetical protein HAZT_HAZT001728 [Hyalella azteca]|uniref:Uncharacterized protein n=1 Tax=Hyalella azteca TaxID=294128 RepID=A0A6A0H8N7_HYAAZ|nr:hypothetical protein HAZT_HAZT001728 [Hyalella azteca]